ncbi:MAG TPA: acetate--CoA ligase family protein [Candidatus Baltobacteraceae bacterium]|nr:acetate--CoA ligase family protein [Candidatus Baltobacteraceae bacterium]
MLDGFFKPKAVAVVGASREEGKVGFSITMNLIRGRFPGSIYPVNPKADEILGLRCFPDLKDVPADADLAVLVIPPKACLATIEVCAARNIRSVIIISAGFKESGAEGIELEKALRRRVRELGVRVVGPNCLGVIDTKSRLNATFAAGMPPVGEIGFFSQSGALCTAILDWAIGNDVGFSKFISLGNKADTSEADFIEALAADPETRVVIGYIEGVEDGRRFMQVAKVASRLKPLIIVKSGRTSAGARAASSHTGTLAGSDRAFTAAFKQSGILRAESIEELFNFARAFAYQPLTNGPRLCIVTNAGGPGIIAADAVERSQVKMATLSAATIERIKAALPPTAALYNPVDIIGDAREDRFQAALEAVGADPGVDGVLALSTPQAMTDYDKFAGVVGQAAKASGKPFFAAFMGEASLTKARQIFRQANIPQYPYPEPAIQTFEAMVKYREWLTSTPAGPAAFPVERERVAMLFKEARKTGRLQLGETEAREVIAAYGFRLPQNVLARTVDEAVATAERIGFPVALKIVSPEILHKTDVGGVRLNCQDAQAVAQGFSGIDASVRRFFPTALIQGIAVQEMVVGGKEVILGMTRDPSFGPLLMFGLGGIYVEVLKDVAFRIAPIGADEAEAMIREIRSFPLLRGVRGEKPSDMAAMIEALGRLSQLCSDFPEILELDVNPLLVKPEGHGAVAIDARLVLAPERG